MRRGGWILLLLLAGVVLIVVGSRGPADHDEPTTTPTAHTAQTQAPQSSQGLPREAYETIALIESDGPFPTAATARCS